MAEIFLLSSSIGFDISNLSSNFSVLNYSTFTKFNKLISCLFQKGNNECDTNHITIVVVDKEFTGDSQLDKLPFQQKKLLLKYYFNHLNLLVLDPEAMQQNLPEITATIAHVNGLMTNRISRVETWTGTGETNINDYFDINTKWPAASDLPSTMSFILANNCAKSPTTIKNVQSLTKMMIEEIDFLDLLSNHSRQHLHKLTNLVGHWAFPAHELTNDDLVYCVYLMINYALTHIDKSTTNIHFPTSNELLAFVFAVRDTYKNGNPFHNFRHAVDVLQGCFHFLIRLNCLKGFKQFQANPNSDELKYLHRDDFANNVDVELAMDETKSCGNNHSSYLNPLQTLGLLVAALGHDVGHPGVTNAFMVKHFAPTSLIYNERSVLESYHTSVFINRVLGVHWPSLLAENTENESLTLRELIMSSILATDMAEHFEYIAKLTTLKTEHFNHEATKVKLISSLLIKCADISNVTRPLRVSSQWALVLAREFEEVSILEKKISHDSLLQLDLNKDLLYAKVPHDLKHILEVNSLLHKGQIFFINTFAENLFNNIAEFLPELTYTCDIIQQNKQFWLNRDKQ